MKKENVNKSMKPINQTIYAHVRNPFTIKQCEDIYNAISEVEGAKWITLYLGINDFTIINIGCRTYKYSKVPKPQHIITKILYTIKNNV